MRDLRMRIQRLRDEGVEQGEGARGEAEEVDTQVLVQEGGRASLGVPEAGEAAAPLDFLDGADKDSDVAEHARGPTWV